MTDNARIDELIERLRELCHPMAERMSDTERLTALVHAGNEAADALARRSIQDQPEGPVGYISSDGFTILIPDDQAARFKAAWEALPTGMLPNKALPFYLDPPPIAGAGWNSCDDVPAALTLIVARFDAEMGEWIVGVAESYMIGKEPTSIPKWTHWRYLPAMPDASPVPDNTDARGTQVSVRDAGGLREELRLLATAQPLSGERSTYSDGFANGLFHAIERLDRALDPVKAPKP